MTNTNCLENIKCPACGNEESFRIAGTTIFTVTDDGTEDHGDIEWDDESYAECTACLRHGTLKDFQVIPQPASTIERTRTRDNKPVYDNYEISGCWKIGDGADSYIETCDEANAQFWTLYGHMDGAGVEAIGNFISRAAAEEVYYRITGQPFTASYEADARLRLMHAAQVLLAALKYALEYLKANDDGEQDVLSRIAASESAIAKAEPEGEAA